jgi:hypothetical protein
VNPITRLCGLRHFHACQMAPAQVFSVWSLLRLGHCEKRDNILSLFWEQSC